MDRNLCSFSLIDDDGIMVLTTVRQMEFWKENDFQYEIPTELLQQMEAKHLISWQTSGGEIAIELEAAHGQIDETSQGPYALQVLEDDQLVFLPYSHFSYSADCEKGKIADVDGMVYGIEWPAGEYYFFIKKQDDGLWIVTIKRADESTLAKAQSLLADYC